MPTKNRQMLKERFGEGQRPTAEDFQNLIDSSVNILDDGFSKNVETGVQLAPISKGGGTVMTFQQNMIDAGSHCKINVLGEGVQLRISNAASEDGLASQNKNDGRQVLMMRYDGDLELGNNDREVHLQGVLRVEKRLGKLEKEVDANGNWQDMTGSLTGIHALEILCVMGEQKTGKHAILTAYATHCFGAKPRIRKTASHYGSFGNRLCLRWVRSADYSCKLQVRTRFAQRSGMKIQCYTTSLWENHLMEK